MFYFGRSPRNTNFTVKSIGLLACRQRKEMVLMAHWIIDIHTHILPAVGDGAEDQNMSLLMLLRAKEQGITHIFATPHSSAFAEVDVRKYRTQLCGGN